MGHMGNPSHESNQLVSKPISVECYILLVTYLDKQADGRREWRRRTSTFSKQQCVVDSYLFSCTVRDIVTISVRIT